ncbi:hypothetical protein QJQ45_017866 [Haematococcus lacustris]|nr:hypothetical protein QJQ45_017866 [Haematococcus lacustris]
MQAAGSELGGPTMSDSLIIRPWAPKDTQAVQELFARGMWHNYSALVKDAYIGCRLPHLLSVGLPLLAARISSGQHLATRLLAMTGGLLALPVAVAATVYKELGGYIKHSVQGDLSSISQVYGTPGSAFWVAELNNTVVGCVALERKNDSEAELRRMSVSTTLHRGGVGMRLAKALILHAHKAGFKSVYLTTSGSQRAALALYRKMGWRERKVARDGMIAFYELELDVAAAAQRQQASS